VSAAVDPCAVHSAIKNTDTIGRGAAVLPPVSPAAGAPGVPGVH